MYTLVDFQETSFVSGKPKDCITEKKKYLQKAGFVFAWLKFPIQ